MPAVLFALVLLFPAASDLRRPYGRQLTPHTQPTRDAAQADAGGMLLWADTKLWRDAPIDVESWVSVIGMDLLNSNAAEVEFRLEDLYLEDDHGRKTAPFFTPARLYPTPTTTDALWKGVQRAPPNTDDVEGLMVDGRDNTTSVFITDYWRGPPASGAFGQMVGVGSVPRDWTLQIRPLRVPKDLGTRSIFNRKLGPGRHAHGYVSFPVPAQDVQSVWLVWAPEGGDAQARIQFDVR